jgi:hypothetical protein
VLRWRTAPVYRAIHPDPGVVNHGGHCQSLLRLTNFTRQLPLVHAKCEVHNGTKIKCTPFFTKLPKGPVPHCLPGCLWRNKRGLSNAISHVSLPRSHLLGACGGSSFNQDVAVTDAPKKNSRIGGLVAGVLWRSKTAVYSRLDSAAGRGRCPRSTGNFQCRRLGDGCLLAAAWSCGQKAQKS